MFASATTSFIRKAVRSTAASSSVLQHQFRNISVTPAVLEKLNVQGLADKVNLEGQNVLMRVDLNVPLSKDDDVTVTDDTRLRAIAPTTKFLLEKGANVILCSHFGSERMCSLHLQKDSC